MEERLTKKELKEQKRLENLKKMEESQTSSGSFGKIIIISAVILLFVGLASYLFVNSKIAQKQREEVSIALTPEGQKTGSESAKVTLVEFGDFQCPACKAKVTLVEFGDFQCPACKAYEPAVKQIKESYKDDVLFIYKHFPLKNAHPNAVPAAIAAEAASRQDKFWEFHDLLYSRQDEWAGLMNANEKFLEYASELGLDTDQFANDLTDKKLVDIVNKQVDEGIKVGVSATPTFFLNGKFMNVNASFDSFKKLIDQALSEESAK